MFNRESEAWAALALQLEREGLEKNDEGESFGLCYEIDEMMFRDHIDGAIHGVMSRRISAHLRTLPQVESRVVPGTYRDDVWLAPPGEVEPRIIAAQLLALEAAEEGN